eukprot:Pompholyxophrys_punicea_v1_NODE_1517_length_667_cov_13.210784.p1 type:complete len:108 gc:universal NODE_1517_length_667_cov_13.210784:332-9(-)
MTILSSNDIVILTLTPIICYFARYIETDQTRQIQRDRNIREGKEQNNNGIRLQRIRTSNNSFPNSVPLDPSHGTLFGKELLEVLILCNLIPLLFCSFPSLIFRSRWI